MKIKCYYPHYGDMSSFILTIQTRLLAPLVLKYYINQFGELFKYMDFDGFPNRSNSCLTYTSGDIDMFPNRHWQRFW
jgi:hypothetical protein